MREKIELREHCRRAIRWLPNGMGLPMLYDEAVAKINRGVAERVYA